MAAKKLAYVTGTSANGYQLKVDPDKCAAEFRHMCGLMFTSYRAVQDIANAINDNIRRKRSAPNGR
ncbi:TPA: hypothetical protein NID01_000513 [Pseudomonas aeruginosa]|nr:hypothetical protein [Pseudomonas aeruginosa]